LSGSADIAEVANKLRDVVMTQNLLGFSQSPDFKLSGETKKDQEMAYFERGQLTCDEFKLIDEYWITAASVRDWRR